MELETANHWSLWSSGIGGFANAGSTPNQPGYNFTTGGAMIGADYRAGDHLVFGLVGTYVNANSSSSDGANIDVNGGKLGVYGTWWDDDGNYVQGYAGGGFDSFETQRTIYLPGYLGGGITPGATGSSNPADSVHIALRGAIPMAGKRTPASPLATIGSSAISSSDRRPECSMITCRHQRLQRNRRATRSTWILHHQTAQSLQSLVGFRAKAAFCARMRLGPWCPT